MKAVFDTKSNSGYDDEIIKRYHFPTQRNYLAAAEAAVGDWIVYREPQRNGGRRAYIAVARVLAIEPDTLRPSHAYAIIGDYLPFDRPVPFAGQGSGYWEAPLRAIENANRVGATLQGKAVRSLSDADFSAIVVAGLVETLSPQNAVRLGLAEAATIGVAEINVPFDHGAVPGVDQVRRIEKTLLNRKIRDANFRRQIYDAYEDRCAVTGLRIINGGGRSEVQAAHIWSVGDGGPDVVQNGLALSPPYLSHRRLSPSRLSQQGPRRPPRVVRAVDGPHPSTPGHSILAPSDLRKEAPRAVYGCLEAAASFALVPLPKAGSVILPRRCRTLLRPDWANHRLSIDFEGSMASAATFLYAASVMLLTRRLAQAARFSKPTIRGFVARRFQTSTP